MSDCPDCGGTGFTLTMDPCVWDHGVSTFVTRPPMAADVAEAIEATAPSVYDYDEPAPEPKAVWAPPTGRATMTKAPPKAATPAQEEFIRRLIAERDPTSTIVEMAKVALKEGLLTAKRASDLITALMDLPKTAAASVRPNNFAGTCVTCGTNVEAKAGRIEKIDGRWRTFHLDGGCPSPATLIEILADVVTEPGVYHQDGFSYLVKPGRYDKTELWAKRIVVRGTKVEFVRAGRASFLKASEKISLAEARSFGVAVGSCIYCGLTLDGEDGKSVTAGYGKRCSEKYHLPYPSTADMKAIAAEDTTWDDLLASKYA